MTIFALAEIIKKKKKRIDMRFSQLFQKKKKKKKKNFISIGNVVFDLEIKASSFLVWE